MNIIRPTNRILNNFLSPRRRSKNHILLVKMVPLMGKEDAGGAAWGIGQAE